MRCRHFDPLSRISKCDLGQGRFAPDDCKCEAYDCDPLYRAAGAKESDRCRDDAWDALVKRRVAAMKQAPRAEGML